MNWPNYVYISCCGCSMICPFDFPLCIYFNWNVNCTFYDQFAKALKWFLSIRLQTCGFNCQFMDFNTHHLFSKSKYFLYFAYCWKRYIMEALMLFYLVNPSFQSAYFNCFSGYIRVLRVSKLPVLCSFHHISAQTVLTNWILFLACANHKCLW